MAGAHPLLNEQDKVRKICETRVSQILSSGFRSPDPGSLTNFYCLDEVFFLSLL